MVNRAVNTIIFHISMMKWYVCTQEEPYLVSLSSSHWTVRLDECINNAPLLFANTPVTFAKLANHNNPAQA